MYDIRMFCWMIDENKPDFLELCKDKSLVPQFYQSTNDLPPKLMEAIHSEEQRYYELYMEKWKRMLVSHIQYKKPNFINGKIEGDEIFMLPTFMKNGM
jgi:hypothetical protein